MGCIEKSSTSFLQIHTKQKNKRLSLKFEPWKILVNGSPAQLQDYLKIMPLAFLDAYSVQC